MATLTFHTSTFSISKGEGASRKSAEHQHRGSAVCDHPRYDIPRHIVGSCYRNCRPKESKKQLDGWVAQHCSIRAFLSRQLGPPAPILGIPSLVVALFCPIYATLNLSFHMRAGIFPAKTAKTAPRWNRLILPAALLVPIEILLGVAYNRLHIRIPPFTFLGASFLAIALLAFFGADIAHGLKAMGRTVDRGLTAMEAVLDAALERTVNAATAASRTFSRVLQRRLFPLIKAVVDPAVPIKPLEALGATITAAFSTAFNWVLGFRKPRSHSTSYQSMPELRVEDDLPAAQSTKVALYNSKLPATPQEFPVPEIPLSRPPEFLQLKLKRSQRLGFFGRVIFILDARMELNREELELVRKYRLADNVIYESASRKRRKEATLAHLERTRDDTSRIKRFREYATSRRRQDAVPAHSRRHERDCRRSLASDHHQELDGRRPCRVQEHGRAARFRGGGTGGGKKPSLLSRHRRDI